jgi:hypothetical protein
VNERVHTPMPAGRWRLERRLVLRFPSESDLLTEGSDVIEISEGALLLAIAKVESGRGWRLTLLVRVQEQEEES